MDKAPTLDQLREELRRAIKETSGREVARELVVSPTGLKKFVDDPRSTARSAGKLSASSSPVTSAG